ncbi:MAG: hypothetical protein M1819_005442 [Sarea resinae]|nr:MAG: hypothetical protein M1819_005442 [Sarea resinae]
MTSAMGASFEAIHAALLQPRDNSGSSDNDPANSNSLSGFVSTLVPVALVAGITILGFLILRTRVPRQFAPRTFLGSLRPEQRSPDLPKGFLNWLKTFFSFSDSYILNHQSLDSYLFLRYLKIIVVICLVGSLITWPVLFPVNATGGAGEKQFDLLSFSNIKGNKYRYLAHNFIGWIYFSFILYMVTRESIFYVNLRQAYLLSPLYANRISSRTVLYTSVPKKYLDEGKLRRLFGKDLKNLWVSTDTKNLEDMVKERDKIAMKLEGAENKLITSANSLRLKALKKNQNDEEAAPVSGETAEDGRDDGESGSIASRWIPDKKRPTHRLKFLIGKKVDTINWSRSELASRNVKIEEEQALHKSGAAKAVGSVFVEFVTPLAAQSAYQRLTHHQALHMAPRYIGISPEEVIWSNLRILWWERVMRLIACTSFVVLLIIFWSIPVAVVGAISNINFLTSEVHFLRFINDIPQVILGVVTGLLPSVLLSVLMSLLPIILRAMAKWGGDVSLSEVELTVQNSYFGFQVVQVFLVTTLASGAASSAATIVKNPSSATTLLATQLPKASNFYISYIVLQGLGIASGALLSVTGLVLFTVLGKLLDKTPRKMYKRWSSLSGLGWGTVFPVYTNLCVIAITYSCIAPLVLGFATVGLWLLYLAYRYNIFYVYDTNIDTKGLVYPRALQQTLTGVYLAELCLIGLFAIRTAIAALVLMIVFLIFTALYHLSLNAALDPLLKSLPRTLEVEEESLLAEEAGLSNSSSNSNSVSNEKATVTQQPTIESHGTSSVNEGLVNTNSAPLPPAPHKKPNLFTKWLRPDLYTDYHTLRRLVPRQFAANVGYDEYTEKHAYYHPDIASTPPLLWVPRDSMGVSRQEVRHTSKVNPITDEAAYLDDKGKVVWDREVDGGRPPIYQEKVYY